MFWSIHNLILLFAVLVPWLVNAEPMINQLTQMKADFLKLQQSQKAAEKKIKTYEKEIEVEHKIYMQLIRENVEKEDLLELKRNGLQGEMDLLLKKYQKTKRRLAKNLLYRQSEMGGASSLLIKKQMQEKLQIEIQELKKQIQHVTREQQLIKELEEGYGQQKQQEILIQKKLDAIETSKQLEVENYLSLVGQLDELQGKINQLRIALPHKTVVKQLSKRRAGGGYRLPLDSYREIKHQQKGVTMFYQGVNPVYVPRKGEVVYTGSLGAFGQVVMLDHGEQQRSVILGPMDIKVKKGDFMEKGALLGYTKQSMEREEKIYFEIRENHNILNTILQVDDKLLRH